MFNTVRQYVCEYIFGKGFVYRAYKNHTTPKIMKYNKNGQIDLGML